MRSHETYDLSPGAISFPLAAGAIAAAAISRKACEDHSFPMGFQLYTVNAEMMKHPAGTLKWIAPIGQIEAETVIWGTLSVVQFCDLLKIAGLRAPSAHLMFGMRYTAKLRERVSPT